MHNAKFREEAAGSKRRLVSGLLQQASKCRGTRLNCAVGGRVAGIHRGGAVSQVRQSQGIPSRFPGCVTRMPRSISSLFAPDQSPKIQWELTTTGRLAAGRRKHHITDVTWTNYAVGPPPLLHHRPGRQDFTPAEVAANSTLSLDKRIMDTIRTWIVTHIDTWNRARFG